MRVVKVQALDEGIEKARFKTTEDDRLVGNFGAGHQFLTWAASQYIPTLPYVLATPTIQHTREPEKWMRERVCTDTWFGIRVSRRGERAYW